MLRQRRNGAARRIMIVAAVLLGIVFMHGMSGTVPGAAAHTAAMSAETPPMDEMPTIATSNLAFSAAAGRAAVSSEPDLASLVAYAGPQEGDQEHVGMYLMGLCLALLTIILLVARPAAGLRPWAVLRLGTWRPILRRSFPVRCRAPDLFALGVIRC